MVGDREEDGGVVCNDSDEDDNDGMTRLMIEGEREIGG